MQAVQLQQLHADWQRREALSTVRAHTLYWSEKSERETERESQDRYCT